MSNPSRFDMAFSATLFLYPFSELNISDLVLSANTHVSDRPANVIYDARKIQEISLSSSAEPGRRGVPNDNEPGPALANLVSFRVTLLPAGFSSQQYITAIDAPREWICPGSAPPAARRSITSDVENLAEAVGTEFASTWLRIVKKETE
jgi:hypothetical protein